MVLNVLIKTKTRIFAGPAVKGLTKFTDHKASHYYWTSTTMICIVKQVTNPEGQNEHQV